MGAEEAETLEGVERRRGVPLPCRLDHARGRSRRRCRGSRPVVSAVAGSDGCRASQSTLESFDRELGQGGVRVPGLDRAGEAGNGAPVAPDVAQHDDPVPNGRARRHLRVGNGMPRRLLELRPDRLTHAEPARGGTDDVAEHGAGFDRRQLLVVADDDQPARQDGAPRGAGPSWTAATMEVSSTTTTSWRSGFDLLCRNRVRLPPARPRSRCSVIPRSARSRSTVPGFRPSRGRLVAHRFLQPQRRLPRRRRQGDERRCGAVGDRLLVEQRQQAGHGRGLARPRSSGDDRDPAENGGRGGQRLQVVGILGLRVVLAEQRRQAARRSARSTSGTSLSARASSSVATCRSSSQRRFRYRFDPDSQSGLPGPTSGL